MVTQSQTHAFRCPVTTTAGRSQRTRCRLCPWRGRLRSARLQRSRGGERPAVSRPRPRCSSSPHGCAISMESVDIFTLRFPCPSLRTRQPLPPTLLTGSKRAHMRKTHSTASDTQCKLHYDLILLPSLGGGWYGVVIVSGNRLLFYQSLLHR